MKRQFILISLLVLFCVVLLLAACSSDPCSAGDNLPSCQTSRSAANATIVAINSSAEARARQAQMQSTQDAIALQAQATQGAINSKATANAVEMAATQGAGAIKAQATRQSVELDALRQQVVVSATQSAISIGALKQQVVAEATRTSLEGDTKVRAAEVQASTAQTGQIVWFIVALGLVVSLAVFLIWYGRRAGNAMAHGLEVRASLVRYGINNSRVALVTPGPKGDKHVFLIEELIGPHALASGSKTLLDMLELPDQVKLMAAIEQAKRSKAALIAAATGQFPALGSGNSNQLNPPLPASGEEEPVNGDYRILSVAPEGDVGRWVREVDNRLALEAGAIT